MLNKLVLSFALLAPVVAHADAPFENREMDFAPGGRGGFGGGDRGGRGPGGFGGGDHGGGGRGPGGFGGGDGRGDHGGGGRGPGGFGGGDGRGDHGGGGGGRGPGGFGGGGRGDHGGGGGWHDRGDRDHWEHRGWNNDQRWSRWGHWRRGGWNGWGGGPGANDTELYCGASNNDNFLECNFNGRIQEAWVIEQFSNEGCIQDQSWGINDSGIWVNNGCQAQFHVVYFNN